MKILKYLTYSLVLSLMVVSCDKHEIKYDTKFITENDAEFQLHYFEPISTASANNIDSVFVNDVLYSSVNGSGQLVPLNGVPGGGVGRFFAVASGDVNFKFWRGGSIIYNQNATLKPGKQNVIVCDLDKAPFVVDNDYPYWNNTVSNATPETFDTDSCESVMFVNLLYESPGVPYPGKLQYMYQDYRTKEWKPVGEPVGFGEATTRTKITIVKETHNSSGSRRVDYRLYDTDGNRLVVAGSNYSDWWTGYIGRSYIHFFGGYRTSGNTPKAAVKVWTSK